MEEATVLKYNVIIYKENNNYIAEAPTLGVSDFGKTVEKARENIKQAILCHLEGLHKTKSEIPAPDIDMPYVSQAEIRLPSHFAPAF